VKRSEALLILKRRNVNGAQTSPPRPANLAERTVRVAERQAQLMVDMVQAALREVDLSQSRYPRSRCDRADDQDHLIDPAPSSRSWSQVGTVSTIIELPGRLSAPYDGGR
jgi:hypothetical protein